MTVRDRMGSVCNAMTNASWRLHAGNGSGTTMLRWIADSLRFLYWLAVLHLARWAVVLFCAVEVLGVLVLWPVGFVEARQHDSYRFLLLPVGGTLLVAVQVALWQFTWLRLAQRGGKWRVLAEWFTDAARYPVVREPHPWE